MTIRLVRVLAVAATCLAAGSAAAAAYTYRHVLDGSSIEVPREGLGEAVQSFHQSGDNPFVGDDAALADGKKIYQRYCQACHMPDGSGRIGPSFLDDQWNYETTATMRGRFAIVYAGGAGAMQAFNDRLSQKQILEVLAYIEKLQAEAGN